MTNLHTDNQSSEFENLPAIESDPQLWLGMLVDNELNRDQRRQMMDYLEAHPTLWKSCALQFLDEQILASELASISSSAAAQPAVEPASMEATRPGFWLQPSRSLTRLVVVVLLGICIGQWWTMANQSAGTNHVWQLSNEELDRELTEITDKYREVYEVSANHQETQSRREIEAELNLIQSLLIHNRFLVEVENTDQRSVYLTDDRLPKFLLEALVLAGHQVQVKRKDIEVKRANGEPFNYPIHSLEITKYALLSSLNSERKNHVD